MQVKSWSVRCFGGFAVMFVIASQASPAAQEPQPSTEQQFDIDAARSQITDQLVGLGLTREEAA